MGVYGWEAEKMKVIGDKAINLRNNDRKYGIAIGSKSIVTSLGKKMKRLINNIEYL